MSSNSPSPAAKHESDLSSVVIHCERATISGRHTKVLRRIGISLLLASLLLNVWFIWEPFSYRRPAVAEQHLQGTAGASDRIAVINFEGTISPPFTSRWLRQLKQAQEDKSIHGVLLVIDSPGGFVADSHQLYREIQKLAKEKPVNVAMKRIAASGGYYIAMGIGKEGVIYVEPTTWTGSIGVIIPRYNATDLAEKFGVKSEPLVTGPLKDTLNPFRDMTDQEKTVWGAIMEDAFSRFVTVIADNRPELDDAAVRQLATGQIYTANQAVDNHMVDRIGYVEDAIEEMAHSLKLTSYEAIEYRSSPGLIDMLIGANASQPKTLNDQILQASVPQAMYYASWNPWIP